jgi:oligopeptide/dipeptide ABC transporter ATP-binding protein
MSQVPAILTVRDLRTYFFTQDGVVRAVDGLSFAMAAGGTFALVGESGCGKSVTAMSILRLIPTPPGKIVSGKIILDGQDVLSLSEKQMRRVRGRVAAMIFQEPMTSLNPVYTIGNQIVEGIELHQGVSGRAARDLAIAALAEVGIPEPAQRYGEYPHQLSGGMRQRAMIAMALGCDPKLLIADEPTTALDVTIQAQILELLRRLQRQRGLSIMLITHDLAVVAEMADVVGVMYAARLVELADVRTLFAHPMHPYTVGLFRSLPRLGQRQKRLETIPGTVPNLTELPEGCRFSTRCPDFDRGICRAAEPELREVEPGHWVACRRCPGYDQAKATDPSERTLVAPAGDGGAKP